MKKYFLNLVGRIKSNPVHYALIFLSMTTIYLLAYFVLDSWGRNKLLIMGADEPQWVENAVKYFHAGVGSPYAHVPLFHDLIIPFVSGIFCPLETGYIIWKIMLFVLSSTLLFYILYKISNLWIALFFTLHYELMEMYIAIPSYSILAMTFFLIALAIIVRNKTNIGIAFGILIIGGMVRLELILFGITFFILSAIFLYRLVFTRKFLLQITLPIIIFISLIYWHGSSITSFPKDYLFRGNQSAVWYIIDYMYYEGYFKKYTDEGRGNIPPEIQDKVLMEYFGKTLEQLDNTSFWDTYKANPKIIQDRYKKMLSELPQLLTNNFVVKIPYDDARGFYYKRLLTFVIFPFVLFIPLIKLYKKTWTQKLVPLYDSYLFKVNKISLPLVLLLLASFSGFIPWLMTKPMEHYTIMVLPTLYIIFVIIIQLLCLGVEKKFSITTKSQS